MDDDDDYDDVVVVDGKQGQHGEQCILQTFRHRETGEPQSPQAEGSVPRYLLQTHYQTRFSALRVYFMLQPLYQNVTDIGEI